MRESACAGEMHVDLSIHVSIHRCIDISIHRWADRSFVLSTSLYTCLCMSLSFRVSLYISLSSCIHWLTLLSFDPPIFLLFQVSSVQKCSLSRCLWFYRAIAALGLHRRLVEAPLAQELAEIECSTILDLQKAPRRAKARRAQTPMRLHRRRIEPPGQQDSDGHLFATVGESEAEFYWHRGRVFCSGPESFEETRQLSSSWGS